MDALHKAIGCVGSGKELARRLGVVPMTVTQWKKRGRVPVKRCIDIERETGGAVTRYDLRPDLYGSSSGALTDAAATCALLREGAQ